LLAVIEDGTKAAVPPTPDGILLEPVTASKKDIDPQFKVLAREIKIVWLK
jgi:hypothetical protein